MAKTNNERNAHIMIEAIKKMANSPEHLYNFESYLSAHFDTWMEKWAGYPEGLSNEFKNFSEMEF